MKKTLLLLAATLIALSASVPPVIAGGNPLCPPRLICHAQ